MMAKSGEKAPSRLIISAEIMIPDEFWLPATVAISTHNQKSFITDALINKFGICMFVFKAPTSLSIKAPLQKKSYEK